MKKLKTLNKWFAVQLTDYVLCGEINTKWGPKVVYTQAIWGLHGEHAVCRDAIYKLGQVDRVWIKSKEADKIDDYEIN